MFDFKTVLAVVYCVCVFGESSVLGSDVHTQTHTHTHKHKHTHTHTESDRVKERLTLGAGEQDAGSEQQEMDGGERYTDAWHRHDVTTHPRSVPAHNAPATLSQPAENTE